jgi:hypothetical protein
MPLEHREVNPGMLGQLVTQLLSETPMQNQPARQ